MKIRLIVTEFTFNIFVGLFSFSEIDGSTMAVVNALDPHASTTESMRADAFNVLSPKGMN